MCTVIVAIFLTTERGLHYDGKYFKKKNQKPLYEALQKVKEGNIYSVFASSFLFSLYVIDLYLCISLSRHKNLYV
ncbi:hypothetical protein ACS0TY_021807 [Phlomoides rotata]